MNKFDVSVDTRLCKACGLCVLVCPKKVFELRDEDGKSVPVNALACIGCTQCYQICPDFAITVYKKEGALA
nr:4Fe-4S dicluster domain-containing protein [Coprothermobacter platensis]